MNPAAGNRPRVALLGYGNWGRNIARNLEVLGALAAVADPTAEARDRAAADLPGVPILGEVTTVLESDVPAVAIASPAEHHGELVARCLDAGKDVFVEKPLCLDVGEGRALVARAADAERVLMVGHLLWYHPAVLALQRLVDEGALGRLQYVYSNRLNLGRIRREENILWSFAPHDISVILGLVREEPKDVDAIGGFFLHAEIADVTVSTLSFPSGVKAHVFVSWLHPFKEQRLVVVGDKAMAVFEDTAPDHKLVVYPHQIEWRAGMPVPVKADGTPVNLIPTEPLRAEMEHFLDCVATRETPRTDGAEGLRVLEVLDACQRALNRD